MTDAKLLVKTTLGSTVLDLESIVNVHLNENSYLEKQALDLNPGDSVVYRKEFIQTTLEQVEPLLELSPRYMHAKMKIMEKNSLGNYVPMLRTELWRGILKRKGEYHPSLEARIKQENDDFTTKERTEARNFISARLESAGIEKARQTLSAWLNGDTYAPADWGIFRELGKINHIFRDFDSSNTNTDGKYYNYKLFVIARQSVMRYLAELRGIRFKADGEGSEEAIPKDKLGIKLSNEIDIVVRSLMQDVKEQYALARIISIEKLAPKHSLTKEIKKNPQHELARGIETSAADLGMKKSLGEFMQDYFDINSLFSGLLNEYISAKRKKEFHPFKMKDMGNIKGYGEAVKHLFMYKYNEPETYRESSGFTRLENLMEFEIHHLKLADKSTSILLKDLFSGKIDRFFKLPEDSFKNLLEAEYKMRRTRPRLFHEQEVAYDSYENSLRKLYNYLEGRQKTGKPYLHNLAGKIISYFKSLKGRQESSESSSRELHVPSGTEETAEYREILSIAREKKEILDKISRRIEGRFPVKCRSIDDGNRMIRYLQYTEETRVRELSSVLAEYRLEAFKETKLVYLKGD